MSHIVKYPSYCFLKYRLNSFFAQYECAIYFVGVLLTNGKNIEGRLNYITMARLSNGFGFMAVCGNNADLALKTICTNCA